MAESSETKNIKLTLKTPKEKKDVEVSEEASVKEVTFSFLIVPFYFFFWFFFFGLFQLFLSSLFVAFFFISNCFDQFHS